MKFKYYVDAFDRPSGVGSGGLLGSTHVNTYQQAFAWADARIASNDGWLSRTKVLVIGTRHRQELGTKTFVKQDNGEWLLESYTRWIPGEGFKRTVVNGDKTKNVSTNRKAPRAVLSSRRTKRNA